MSIYWGWEERERWWVGGWVGGVVVVANLKFRADHYELYEDWGIGGLGDLGVTDLHFLLSSRDLTYGLDTFTLHVANMQHIFGRYLLIKRQTPNSCLKLKLKKKKKKVYSNFFLPSQIWSLGNNCRLLHQIASRLGKL